MAKNIFSATELYNFVLGETIANKSDSHWTTFTPYEYEEKYDLLSELEQNEFDKRLKEAAKKFKGSFKHLPEQFQWQRDSEFLEELDEAKNELEYEIAEFLKEFLED